MHRSQELKEMLPEGVLSIAIRAHFGNPRKNDRKAELIKYWHQRAVLDRMNIQPCHGRFTVMPKRTKMCRFFFWFFLVTLFVSTRFLRNYWRYKIINAPLEPLRPAYVPFGDFVDIASHFRGDILPKPQFWGREQAFSSQTGKILKVSCYRKYCINFNQIWRNDRGHQVVIVGGPSRRPTNPRWRKAAILKKTR